MKDGQFLLWREFGAGFFSFGHGASVTSYSKSDPNYAPIPYTISGHTLTIQVNQNYNKNDF